MSYYGGAAAWAWDTTWTFAADKLLWGIPVALASGFVGTVIAKTTGGSWKIAGVSSIGGAIGGPIIVLLGGFAINLLRFPALHESDYNALAKRIESLENRPIPTPQPASPATDPRYAKLERLAQVQICLDELERVASEDELKKKRESVNNWIFHGNPQEMLKFSPLGAWYYVVRRADQIAKACGSRESIDLNFQPSPEQLENKVSDEPPPTPDNRDAITRYRRFYLQANKAAYQIGELHSYLSAELASLKAQISGLGLPVR